MKIYTSKSGKKFSISQFPWPAKDGVVFLTNEEFDWIKSQFPKVTTEQFDYLWNAKLQDYTYQIIPQIEDARAKTLADFYVPNIKDILLGKKKVEE